MLALPGEGALKSRHIRSLILRAKGHTQQAEQLSQAVISEAQKLDLESWLAHPYYFAALLARDRGNYQEAYRLIRNSVQLVEKDPDEKAFVAQCYQFLGNLALIHEELIDAKKHLAYSLKLYKEVGMARQIAAIQRSLGDICRLQADYTKANSMYSKTLELLEELEDYPQEARVLLSQGQLEIQYQHDEKAAVLLNSAVDLYQIVGDPRGIFAGLFFLVKLHLRRREYSLVIRRSYQGLKVAYRYRIFNPKTFWYMFNQRRTL